MKKEDLLKKWLSDDLTSSERKKFEASDDFLMHNIIVDTAKFFKNDQTVPELDMSKMQEQLSKENNISSNTTIWQSSWLKIAAMVVILLGVGSFFFFSNDTTIYTDIGENMSIELPDHSQVVLNSKSTVSFDQKGWSTNREVELKGEAYFEVAKGKDFEVLTNAGTVSVLGTKFNVKNRENFFEVHCFEGLVKVKYKNGYTENLSAGNSLRIINGTVTFETTPDSSPHWVNKISSFKSVPFEEVIKEFQRQYKVELILQNIDKKRVFTGGFVHKDLEDGLKSITLPLDLTYSIDDKKRIIIAKK
ncbi:FecR family protein [Aquimarina sp. 2-A2]|uniref:FecR family protein n=1 Tax=Aquimarina sp. 2-A2 TaxID=3382644 RepID=UPI00387EF898